MVAAMRSLASWLQVQLSAQLPRLGPMLSGFHSVPSMRQLHLHLISVDFASEYLKSKKHWNSFATPFLLPAANFEAQLAQGGRVTVAAARMEGALKEDMRCPLTGVPLKNMPALKAHLASDTYRQELEKLPPLLEGWAQLETSW